MPNNSIGARCRRQNRQSLAVRAARSCRLPCYAATNAALLLLMNHFGRAVMSRFAVALWFATACAFAAGGQSTSEMAPAELATLAQQFLATGGSRRFAELRRARHCESVGCTVALSGLRQSRAHVARCARRPHFGDGALRSTTTVGGFAHCNRRSVATRGSSRARASGRHDDQGRRRRNAAPQRG